MKYAIVLVVSLAATPFVTNAQKLAGKFFKPVAIEVNGKKESISNDSIPFAMEFIDEKNIVYREMKSNYYVLHHCVYHLKNNNLEIEFLNKKKPPMSYKIEATNDQLQLKDDLRTIYMNRATN